MPTLIVEWPEGRKTAFAVDGSRVTLGRNPSNKITIDNKYISGYHAEFRQIANDRYEIMDLDSFNGTFVNGNPAKKKELQDGDRLLFGLVKAEFKLITSAPGNGTGAGPQKTASNAPHPEILDSTQPVRPFAVAAEAAARLQHQGAAKSLHPKPETQRIATLAATNREVAEFEAKLNEARRESEALRRQLEEAKLKGFKEVDEERSKVRKEIEEAKVKAKTELEEAERKWKADLDALTAKFETSRKEQQELQQKLEGNRKELEGITKELEETRQERDEARRRMANAKQLTAEAEQARKRLESTEKELTARREEVNKFTRELEQAQAKSKAAADIAAKARTEKEASETRLKSLQGEITAAEKLMKEAMDRYQQKAVEHEKQLLQAQTELRETRKNRDSLRQELETTQGEHQKLNAQVEEDRSTLRKLGDQTVRAEAQLRTHREEFQLLQQKVASSRLDMEQAVTKATKERDEAVAKATREKAEAVAVATREKNETIAKARQEIAAAQSELARLQSELSKVRQGLTASQGQLHEAESRYGEFISKMEKMRAQERSLTDHLQMLHRQQFLAEKRQKELEQALQKERENTQSETAQ